jgi:hypothetical protein
MPAWGGLVVALALKQVAAAVQWVERIMRKIDNVFSGQVMAKTKSKSKSRLLKGWVERITKFLDGRNRLCLSAARAGLVAYMVRNGNFVLVVH